LNPLGHTGPVMGPFYLPFIVKHTDHVRNEDLAAYGFLLQVWSLHIIDLEIKIED
jgi:hypothetical protein